MKLVNIEKVPSFSDGKLSLKTVVNFNISKLKEAIERFLIESENYSYDNYGNNILSRDITNQIHFRDVKSNIEYVIYLTELDKLKTEISYALVGENMYNSQYTHLRQSLSDFQVGLFSTQQVNFMLSVEPKNNNFNTSKTFISGRFGSKTSSVIEFYSQIYSEVFLDKRSLNKHSFIAKVYVFIWMGFGKPVLRGIRTLLGLNSNYETFWLLVWFQVIVNGFMIWLGYISNR